MSAPKVEYEAWPTHRARCGRCASEDAGRCDDGDLIFRLESDLIQTRALLAGHQAMSTASMVAAIDFVTASRPPGGGS